MTFTVYFNEDQPFDSAVLMAVETIREGTSLSKGAGAKRLLALRALVMEYIDARRLIQSMKLDADMPSPTVCISPL